MSSKITVGKIVANATDIGWSQAYHAGGFTAVLAVTKTEKEDGEKTLQETGKKLLDTLVSEYFTLTTKDLETIKGAVEATAAKIPPNVQASLVVAAVVKNVLYIVIANQGRALLKRGNKLGLLLEVKPDDNEKIASLSGFLETGDLVLLHTPSFAKIFPHDELTVAFDNKSAEELSEFFAPKVHEAQDGSVSALVFSYHEEPTYAQEMPKKEPEESHEEEKEVHQPLPGFTNKEETPALAKKPFSHRQKLFLTITVILGLVLIGSIVVFQVKQQQAKQQALFASLYNPAKAKYDDATGLLDLNKSLAISDLQDAQSALNDAKGKFDTNSSEEKQILILLQKVNSTLDDAKKVPLLTAQKAADNASPFLSFGAKHDGVYIAQDVTNFYTADATGITQYNKKTLSKTVVVKNSNAYSAIGGFDTYLGNLYILDQKGGIVKYVSTGGSDFTKSAYFADGVTPDLSQAVSISIDSSIWVLTSSGTVTKYTKGKQDSLTVSGLDKPLSGPTQIFTNVDFDNVYILDKGNERVVVLKKDGSFVAQYASDTVRTSSLMDISEKDKKIYLLSGGTVYQLDLK